MIYKNIVNAIRELITSNNIFVGEPLPPEYQLAQRWNVSRNTIRKALAELAAEGVIETRKGAGSFLCYKKFVPQVNTSMGFSEIARLHGKPSTSRVLKFEALPATEDIAAKLKIPSGEWVYQVKRIRLIDNIPMQLENTWLSVTRFPQLTISDMNKSKFDFFERVCGITISGSFETFSTELANQEVARILNISVKDPVIRMETQAVDIHHVILDYSILYNNSYEFNVQYFWPRQLTQK